MGRIEGLLLTGGFNITEPCLPDTPGLVLLKTTWQGLRDTPCQLLIPRSLPSVGYSAGRQLSNLFSAGGYCYESIPRRDIDGPRRQQRARVTLVDLARFVHLQH